MVRAIIFDFGIVLATFDKESACERFAKYCKKSASEIYRELVGSDLEKALESGVITPEDFALSVIDLIGAQELTQEDCLTMWGDMFRTNPGMTDLLRDLHERNIPMVVLSTTNAVHWPYIRKLDAIQLLENWNVPFVLSHIEKALKPESRLFMAALDKLKSAPDETVFVDDLPENIEAARKLGVQAIPYDCRKQPIDYLRDQLYRVLA